ncbi:hypothetical protein AAE026_21290 [Bradyrhizobium sp. DN5]|uniref:hypothetical protein n=1 Tax=Bradyrhizobium sp. DN5 TaxID=3056950 RepID=UPI003524A0FB
MDFRGLWKAGPARVQFYAKDLRQRVAGELSSIIPEHWLELKDGQPAELFEQVYPQQDGFALLMLWIEIEESEEVDDEPTSARRVRDQQARWR